MGGLPQSFWNAASPVGREASSQTPLMKDGVDYRAKGLAAPRGHVRTPGYVHSCPAAALPLDPGTTPHPKMLAKLGGWVPGMTSAPGNSLGGWPRPGLDAR
eukprot:6151316-Alexandrium_andersonii.AAC.1